MNIHEISFESTKALIGGVNVTFSLPPEGRFPKGFPRGELLSVGANGHKNYSHDPLKVLAWVQRLAKEANAMVARRQAGA